jgi:hypothetical protein
VFSVTPSATAPYLIMLIVSFLNDVFLTSGRLAAVFICAKDDTPIKFFHLAKVLFSNA